MRETHLHREVAGIPSLRLKLDRDNDRELQDVSIVLQVTEKRSPTIRLTGVLLI